MVGSGYRAIVPRPGEAIDDRATWIPEAEQLRHLVVRLPRRIVARAAEELIAAGSIDEIQAGVAARHDQHHRRHGSSPFWSTSDSMWPAR